jgi:hypothetical protein
MLKTILAFSDIAVLTLLSSFSIFNRTHYISTNSTQKIKPCQIIQTINICEAFYFRKLPNPISKFWMEGNWKHQMNIKVLNSISITNYGKIAHSRNGLLFYTLFNIK